MKLVVDVISDVICPWCYISKRRLEKAIAALHGQHEIEVRWQAPETFLDAFEQVNT